MSLSEAVPERLRAEEWSWLGTFRGSHPGTQMRYSVNSDSYTLYAVKAIILPSPGTGALSVDVDEDLIKWLLTRQWPNFINMHDTWKETAITEKLYIRMDWAGQTIRDLLPLGWKFTGPHWFDIMRGMANGLSQAHQQNITHGDLKPSNILVNIEDDGVLARIPSDQVFVSDFGVRNWRIRFNKKTEETMRIPGTQPYISPEVFQYGKDHLVPKSDIWALGCIGYELFTGRQLFEYEEMLESYIRNMALGPDHARQAALMEQKEPQMHRIIANCLVVDPTRRLDVWALLGMIGPGQEPYH